MFGSFRRSLIPNDPSELRSIPNDHPIDDDLAGSSSRAAPTDDEFCARYWVALIGCINISADFFVQLGYIGDNKVGIPVLKLLTMSQGQRFGSRRVKSPTLYNRSVSSHSAMVRQAPNLA